MNDIDKIRKGIQLGVDILPLLILLAETVTKIIKIYRENPESVTPAMMERLRGMVDLTESVFD